VKKGNVIKPNYCLSSKSAVGLFLFSFFEPKSLLETSHRLAANRRALGEGLAFAKRELGEGRAC
jgi:hypothetical protein